MKKKGAYGGIGIFGEGDFAAFLGGVKWAGFDGEGSVLV